MVSARLMIFGCTAFLAAFHGKRLATEDHEEEAKEEEEEQTIWAANTVKDLAARNANLEAKDEKGRTPIARAAWEGQLEVVKDLAARNANLGAHLVKPKDVDLVMSQSGCTRSQAIVALRVNDNDIVDAMMDLAAENSCF